MTDVDRASIGRLLPPAAGTPDWDDVLRRSGVRRSSRRRLGVAAIAATALVVVVVGTASAVAPVRALFLGAGPDSQIAFISKRGFGERGAQLVVMSSDGDRRRVLTGLSLARPPAWSPDGRRLAYEHGDNDVHVVNADGSGDRKLRPNLPWRSPAWSPDDPSIALTGQRGIHVVSADSGAGRRVADHGAAPAWSPNGRKIVFTSVRDGDPDVWVMNADGTGQRNLSRHRAADFLPAWSPDGRAIAFVSLRDGRDEIYVVRADGSGLRRVTSDGLQVNSPLGWSPDGTKLVFEGRRRANSNVYVANVDGSGIRNLTRGFGQQPQWSPDGRSIAFVKRGPCGPCPSPGEIYVMDADGSGQRNVTRTPTVDDGWPIWAPGPKPDR